jgi:hypothetical protein
LHASPICAAGGRRRRSPITATGRVERTLIAESPRGTPLASAPPVACGTYQPRAAETGVPHAVVRDHLEDFLRAAAERTDGPTDL